ncbi:expressed unknown protein [Seminavis robusta]|uniref:MOSC domain-containing protein n=1 Tax=Seminavis robusta TaxID=568900 RepID=A0A9N8DJ90_9STRA|nr:expressed unknown protein [Seminavis robusta]|eukprot:Sro112_g055710.1 n/a (280) ;mRNA; r:69585-70424
MLRPTLICWCFWIAVASVLIGTCRIDGVSGAASFLPSSRVDWLSENCWTASSSCSTSFVRQSPTSRTEDATTITAGTVLRTACRKYQKEHSKPSGRQYTTRKNAQSKGIRITTTHGVQDDYNHYRTVALQSTPDRAVSLWTTDVMAVLQAHGFAQVELGDLGENISVDGVPYSFFKVGQQYTFIMASSSLSSSSSSSATTLENSDNDKNVILEITERMEPCGNLCKLPYINADHLQPKERIQKCQELLAVLDQQEGMRGWYAKVIQEGTIQPGDIVKKV